jgi:hypothetical protein
MGDAGEGLIDADSRIQERMEELARARAERSAAVAVDPERVRAMESLRLAKVDLERQMSETSHDGRRNMLKQAIAELDKRIAVEGQVKSEVSGKSPGKSEKAAVSHEKPDVKKKKK